MKRCSIRSLILTVLISLCAYGNSVLAQAKSGSIGISAAIQGFQLDFVLPIWVGDHAVLAPAFGLESASDIASDFTLGLAARGYFTKQKLSTYGGGRFAGLILNPGNGDSITDYLFGGFFGAEYFFDSRFSVGGEWQLNATISDESSGRFGNPGGTNLNTATVVYVTFYVK